MPARIAAIEVSHWHSLYDAAYLRHLAGMPDMQLVGLQDPSAAVAAKRAAALGNPPIFTDYRQMLAATRPDFVIALGRHRSMAETARGAAGPDGPAGRTGPLAAWRSPTDQRRRRSPGRAPRRPGV